MSRRRGRSPPKRRPAKPGARRSVSWPTTMRPGRSSSAVTAAPSSGRSRSPRGAAGDQAAGQRSVPFAADGPGRRGHGRGPARGPAADAARPACRQRDRGAGPHARRDQAAARRAGDGDGALARNDPVLPVDGGRRGGRGGSRTRAERADETDRSRTQSPLGRHPRGDRGPDQGTLRRFWHMFDLSDQAALVTGASGGIGAAIARALHAQGATVMLAGRRQAALEALSAALGERVYCAGVELADPAAADRLIRDAEAAMGRVDILVNNAGITRDALALRMTDEDWQTVLDIDLSAAFRLTRAALRGMVRRRYGRIIAVTSIV